MSARTHRTGERGQILVFVAVSVVSMLGIAALAIDAGYLYDRRNALYAAADAAAKSAAFAYQKNNSSDLWAFGAHDVTVLGFTPVNACGSTSGTALCVNRPPTQGPYAGNNNFVEAIVSRPSTPTFFGKVLGWASANPGARAVAGFVNPNDCIVINEDLTLGNFAFALDGCGIAVGDDLSGTNPNARVVDSDGEETPPVNVQGDCTGYCDSMGDLNTDAAAPADPLAGKLPAVSPPANPAMCVQGLTPVLIPGCYTNISPAVTTLLAGDYYITGTVNIDSLSGDDVFLYLAGAGECPACGGPGGRFNVIGQNKVLHLTAHTAGPYQGVVVWQNITNTNPFSCINCPPNGVTEPFPPNRFTLEWSGAFYMPGVDQEFRNHMTFTPLSGCALFVARNLTVTNGNGSFTNTNCAGLYGGAAFLSIAVTE